MILGTAVSTNSVSIRLTDERWEHIIDEHGHEFSYSDFSLVLDAVEDPDYILRGQRGSLIAVVPERSKFLFVIYRELTSPDGFIITARYERDFDRNKVIWRKYKNKED